MNHLSHRFCALLALLSAATACYAAAEVRWLQTVYDFGAISEDMGAATCTFRYVNTGDEPLVITAARANCGCTTPRYDSAPLAPGDTAGITVSYDPGGRAGRFSKYVMVDMNTTPRRSRLEVKGTVIGNQGTVSGRYPVKGPDGLKLRKDMVAFGPVLKGHSKTVFLEAYNQSRDTVVPSWPSLPPYLNVVWRPETVPPGEQVTFTLTLNTAETPLYGLLADSVQLCSAGDCVPVQIVGIINEDFSHLTPGQRQKAPEIWLPDGGSIDLGRLGETRTGSLKVRNRGRSPLEIRRIYTADPGVSCSISATRIKPGKEALITVTATPEALRGDMLNARVSLITNDPLHPTTAIRVVALP